MSLCGTRSPAWPELKEQVSNDRGSITPSDLPPVQRDTRSLKLRLGSPPALGRAPPDLRLDAALLRGPFRSCRNAWPRHKRRSPHQLGKAVARLLPVLLLRPEALGSTPSRQPPAGKRRPAGSANGRQRSCQSTTALVGRGSASARCGQRLWRAPS